MNKTVCTGSLKNGGGVKMSSKCNQGTCLRNRREQIRISLATNHYGTASVIPATDPEVRVRFHALLDFLGRSGSGPGPTQTHEYNCGVT
jgi:hypothetical protein